MDDIPLIALEEHFFSSTTRTETSNAYVEQFKHIPGLEEKLRDLGGSRLKDMDGGKISLQIISHGPIPGAPDIEESVEINNHLHEAISGEARFAGFATLPMNNPEKAAEELERTVKGHGFVGALIDCHSNGKYYDGPEYLSFWSKVQEMDVAIYIHPTWPSDDMNSRYSGNFSPAATRSLGASGWGWHSETSLHILRLFASGLFDEFPKLKIIIGHFGEMIPFMLERICALSKRWGNIKRDFQTVYRNNLFITTSGVWGLAPMATILMNTPIEHVLYSVDYPFARNEDGLKWIEDLKQSGMVSREQLEMIAYKNAERLLGVKAPRR